LTQTPNEPAQGSSEDPATTEPASDERAPNKLVTGSSNEPASNNSTPSEHAATELASSQTASNEPTTSQTASNEPASDESASDERASNASASDGRAPRRLARALAAPANVLLFVLGCASLLLYLFVIGLPPGTISISRFIMLALAQGALYAVAGVVAWRAPARRSTLLLALAFAALFRLWPLEAGPRLSDDLYRYVWDGRVQAAGVNPYRHVPADPALAHLRDETIYTKINRRDYAPTIYPPVAQMIFYATTRVSESVFWMKLTMVVFEAAAVWAVVALLASFGLPRQRVLLFAWHPLLVWEIAGSGHLDAVMIGFVCLALLARRRGRDGLVGLLLACAALTKLFPVVLAPALWRRRDWRMPAAFAAAFVVAYLPYLSVGARRVLGFLPGYANEEGLQNGERFFILSLARKGFGEGVPAAAFALFALAALGALAAWTLRKGDAGGRCFVARAFALAALFTVLLSPRYSWYFAWLVPFFPLAPARAVVPFVYLTLSSFVLYRSWLGDGPAEMFALGAIIYLPFAALCVASWASARLARGDGARRRAESLAE
jgi:alpha-1,6-mannosyltransferase